MTQDPFIYLLITLTAAHIAGDFVFQTRSDAERKHELPVLSKHAGLAAAAAYVLAGVWSAWIIPLGIFLSHGIVDRLKHALGKRLNTVRSQLGLFLGDQFIHIAVVIFVAVLVADTVSPARLFWNEQFGNAYSTALILLGGAVLTTKVGGICIGMLVQPYLEQIESNQKEGDTGSRGLTDGGKIIGYLERFLIYVFIIAGFPLGIGFLITAKSVFRFGEVSNPGHRMEAEYIIIGTLMSFAYAVVAGYAVAAVLGMV